MNIEHFSMQTLINVQSSIFNAQCSFRFSHGAEANGINATLGFIAE